MDYDGIYGNTSIIAITYLSRSVDSCDLDCGCVGRCCFLNAVTRTYIGTTNVRPAERHDRAVDRDAATLAHDCAVLDAHAGGDGNPRRATKP